jgi:hypothetical protein
VDESSERAGWRFGSPWTPGLKRIFHRPLLVTLTYWLLQARRRWANYWRKRSESRPPHWIRDLLELLDWVNLLPTFCMMAFAPGHFFRRTPEIRKYDSKLYKTPIKFLISAIPFVLGLHWLPVGWFYREGLNQLFLRSLNLALGAPLKLRCCDYSSILIARAITKVLVWVDKATDTRVVSAVLLWLPFWVPLISLLVAFILLLPRLFNVLSTRTILPLLVSVDPRTYLRLRIRDYVWNLSYFAVYFLLAFPICLLLLYAIYDEFLSPSWAVLKFGPLRLWWMGAQSALAVSLITWPYNELLQASVVIPTPLMQTLRFSRLKELLDGFKGLDVLARLGNLKAIEYHARLCGEECTRLRSEYARLAKATARSSKWSAKFSRETHLSFSQLNIYYLAEIQPLVVSQESQEILSGLRDFLVSSGASYQAPVVDPKVPWTRRIARDALLVAVGVPLFLATLWLIAYLLSR